MNYGFFFRRGKQVERNTLAQAWVVCPADFSDAGFVNLEDCRMLADQWLTTGDVLTVDLAGFCGSWLSPCRECKTAK